MNVGRTAFIACLLTVLLASCAANTALYEAPLRDAGGLSERPRSQWNIEEIASDDLANVKPGERPPLSSDEAGLWMVMDQAETRLKTSGHLVRDKELNAYLKGIACRLVPEHCRDIRIYLVRIPHFNASMAPNGAMQIWTGLLLRVENEAQLAAIVGHELGHYLRRHSLQRMRDMVNTTSALVFVQLATVVAGVPVAGDIARMIAVGKIQAFSRDQEREADGYSIALMTRAGYDPRETAKVWGRIIEEEKVDKELRSPSLFLATHPAPEERFDALKELGEKIVAKAGPGEAGDQAFLTHTLAHRADYLRDELRLRNYARMEKLLNGLAERPGQEGELHFFRGELYRHRDQDGDTQKALEEYQEASKTGYFPPEAHREMGLLYRRSGDRQEAVQAFKKYLECAPQASDRKMIDHMIKEMEK